LYVDKTNEALKAPKEFMLIASFNPGYQQGLKELKPSLRQRFLTVEFEYPKAEDEQEILVKETGIENKTAQLLVKMANKIRKMEDEHIRWHKIWGHGGILGFEHASDTSLITKDYFPIRNNPDFLIPLENLEGITLDIDEGYKEGYKIIRPLLTSQTSKPQINLTRELAQIQELVQNEGRLWHE
jgi:hypothetical protein